MNTLEGELLYINEQRFTEEEANEIIKKYLKFPNRGKKLLLLQCFYCWITYCLNK